MPKNEAVRIELIEAEIVAVKIYADHELELINDDNCSIETIARIKVLSSLSDKMDRAIVEISQLPKG